MKTQLRGKRALRQLRIIDMAPFTMKQLSVTRTCDTKQLVPMEPFCGPLDPGLSRETSERLSPFPSDSDKETEASAATARASKVSNYTEATASEAGSDDDPVVPKNHRCFRHEVSFLNSWHHRQWKFDHRICDTCLKAATDSLGIGREYEGQIDISSRSGLQDDFVFNLTLLKEILKCCPRVLYGNNITAECGYVAILAEYKAAHSNAPLREEDMEQGTFWCLFDSPSAHWNLGTGWGQLLYWRRDNSDA
jgi:hypothetical protein